MLRVQIKYSDELLKQAELYELEKRNEKATYELLLGEPGQGGLEVHLKRTELQLKAINVILSRIGNGYPMDGLELPMNELLLPPDLFVLNEILKQAKDQSAPSPSAPSRPSSQSPEYLSSFAELLSLSASLPVPSAPSSHLSAPAKAPAAPPIVSGAAPGRLAVAVSFAEGKPEYGPSAPGGPSLALFSPRAAIVPAPAKAPAAPPIVESKHIHLHEKQRNDLESAIFTIVHAYGVANQYLEVLNQNAKGVFPVLLQGPNRIKGFLELQRLLMSHHIRLELKPGCSLKDLALMFDIPVENVPDIMGYCNKFIRLEDSKSPEDAAPPVRSKLQVLIETCRSNLEKCCGMPPSSMNFSYHPAQQEVELNFNSPHQDEVEAMLTSFHASSQFGYVFIDRENSKIDRASGRCTLFLIPIDKPEGYFDKLDGFLKSLKPAPVAVATAVAIATPVPSAFAFRG